jgi:hypothetical protein
MTQEPCRTAVGLSRPSRFPVQSRAALSEIAGTSPAMTEDLVRA